jgi:peptide deformylase
MAIRRILHYPEPLLKQVSAPVAAIDETIKTLAADMAETMYAAPGVGLAAPQVGVLQRLVVLDCAPKEEPRQLLVAINPEIVAREGEAFEEEGCLSVPGYYSRVARSVQVTVRFLDLDGNTRQLLADGLWAIAFQHELDHLDGILFVDHLSPLKRSLFRKKYKKLMEQQEEQL